MQSSDWGEWSLLAEAPRGHGRGAAQDHFPCTLRRRHACCEQAGHVEQRLHGDAAAARLGQQALQHGGRQVRVREARSPLAIAQQPVQAVVIAVPARRGSDPQQPPLDDFLPDIQQHAAERRARVEQILRTQQRT